MLLSENADNLLPPWAFFVRCVFNSNRLRPGASRESFYEDRLLEKTREELGQCLRRWMLQMAEREPDRLARFIAVHYLAIKSLAVHDDAFYRLFIDMLPFETSRGRATLAQYCVDQETITYADTVDQFRQIAAVAQAQDLWVINAGYTYDRELLERYPEFHPQVGIRRVDAESLSQSFEDVTPAEEDACANLLQVARDALKRSQCDAKVRKFEPASLVALYNISDEGLLRRSGRQASEKTDDHWAGLLASALPGGDQETFAQLVFNYRNPLVQRLAGLRDDTLQRRLVELIYVQALLAGHHPMATHELQMLNNGLMELINVTAGLPAKDKAP
jgi:molecular chaperone HtpG